MKIKGHFDHDDIQRLRSDNSKVLAKMDTAFNALKSENDQLHNELSKALSAPMTQAALRDLLAPTIEVLQETAQLEQDSGWNLQPQKLQSEISRLRAACGEKEK